MRIWPQTMLGIALCVMSFGMEAPHNVIQAIAGGWLLGLCTIVAAEKWLDKREDAAKKGVEQ